MTSNACWWICICVHLKYPLVNIHKYLKSFAFSHKIMCEISLHFQPRADYTAWGTYLVVVCCPTITKRRNWQIIIMVCYSCLLSWPVSMYLPSLWSKQSIHVHLSQEPLCKLVIHFFKIHLEYHEACNLLGI